MTVFERCFKAVLTNKMGIFDSVHPAQDFFPPGGKRTLVFIKADWTIVLEGSARIDRPSASKWTIIGGL